MYSPPEVFLDGSAGIQQPAGPVDTEGVFLDGGAGMQHPAGGGWGGASGAVGGSVGGSMLDGLARAAGGGGMALPGGLGAIGDAFGYLFE